MSRLCSLIINNQSYSSGPQHKAHWTSRDESCKMHYTIYTKLRTTFRSLYGWSKPTQIWFVCAGWRRFSTNSTTGSGDQPYMYMYVVCLFRQKETMQNGHWWKQMKIQKHLKSSWLTNTVPNRTIPQPSSGSGLSQRHKKILDSSTKWLDDDLINARQKILAKQFEHKFVGAGFQTTSNGLCGNYNVHVHSRNRGIYSNSAQWIRQLACNYNNWNEAPRSACLDSPYATVADNVKSSIASLLFTQDRALQLKFVNVVKQAGGFDCGVFAIADVASFPGPRL